jgi:tetratricopeptide (TPR) repeat protein
MGQLTKEQLEIEQLQLENERLKLENRANRKSFFPPFLTGVVATTISISLSGLVSYFVANQQISHEKELSDREVIQQILLGDKEIYEQKLLLEFYRNSDSLLLHPGIIETEHLVKLTTLKAEKEILEAQKNIHKALMIQSPTREKELLLETGISHLNIAMALDEENPEVYFRRALARFEHSIMREQSRDGLSLVLEDLSVYENIFDRKLPAIFYDLKGRTIKDMGNFQEALAIYEKGISEYPDRTFLKNHKKLVMDEMNSEVEN